MALRVQRRQVQIYKIRQIQGTSTSIWQHTLQMFTTYFCLMYYLAVLWIQFCLYYMILATTNFFIYPQVQFTWRALIRKLDQMEQSFEVDEVFVVVSFCQMGESRLRLLNTWAHLLLLRSDPLALIDLTSVGQRVRIQSLCSQNLIRCGQSLHKVPWCNG